MNSPGLNGVSGHASALPVDLSSLAIPAACATEQLGKDLAREMRRRWRRGERPASEAFLNQHPELWQRPEAAVELIYEEYCLRQAAGDVDFEQDILRRFPQWAAPLRVMLDCHRVLQSHHDEPKFPGVGDTVGDFKLLAELGRGSRGRVFLATQAALADRPVVLKVTPFDGAEHLSLARLQHTNIVPLHSVLDDPARNIRILCMPYFGRVTLASFLQSLADVPLAARTGQHFVDAIDRMQQRVAGVESSSPQPTTESEPSLAGGSKTRPQPPPALQMLAHVTYVQAMCWITASLADALQFAHERGLVHLDLKPSNVLLATDGQPMLLDFHLAREPIRPGGPRPDHFGGTPGYMPPEQQGAMQSLQNGRPVEIAVDGRADIYALGAMLYESLRGQLPQKGVGSLLPGRPEGCLEQKIPDPFLPLAEVNPQVSVGLSDIVAKCLARRPEDRYADAAALADDLRRHWTNQPLVGVPNRSIAERWHKWRRRRPSTVRAVGMLAVVAGAAAVLLAGSWSQIRDRRQQAELAVSDGHKLLENGQYAQAVQTIERGLALAESLPLQRDLERNMRDQLTTAKRLRVTQQLHGLADEIRILYGTDSIPASRLQSVASHCRAFWERRQLIVDSLTLTRSASEGLTEFSPRSRVGLVSDVSTDLQDIAIFAAELQVKLADGTESTAARREALRLLDEAEAMFGPSAVLDYERRLHLRALDLAEPAEASSPPRTAWEHCALGRAFLASGELPRAAEELAAALERDPAGRWPNFYYGLCAYRMGRHEDAVAAFSVCIGAAPNVAGCYYNRALAYAALGRPGYALNDYDRALELDPTHAAAALNRGMLHYALRRFDNAIADLRVALEHGADPATIHFDLALVYLAANDRATALDNVQRALERNPDHEQARQLHDSLTNKSGLRDGGR